jgi:molybdenum cofactor biosynthesis enzyme MoaA
MDKLKRFFDCYIPITTCNLHCHYCYITLQGLFKNRLPEFKYSPETIGKAFSQERMGGICHLNFCGGGETLGIAKK